MGIDLIISGGSYTDPVITFCEKKKKLDREVKNWFPSITADGFLESNTNSYTYYFSKKNILWGLPVIISCDKRNWDAISSYPIGNACQFSAPIGSNLSLYVRFYNQELMPFTWIKAFKQIEKFLVSLAIDIPKSSDFSNDYCATYLTKEK